MPPRFYSRFIIPIFALATKGYESISLHVLKHLVSKALSKSHIMLGNYHPSSLSPPMPV